jgi:hypothetical protein
MGMSGQRHAPASFTPGKRPAVPIGQEAEWASDLVWTQRLEEKSFAFAGDQTPVVYSVIRHYTDWSTPASRIFICSLFNFVFSSSEYNVEWQDD